MEVILKTPEKFIARTTASYALLNAIRRSVEEVSAFAIDEVEIFKNDSALYDEVLAHRIGLIPLKTDSKMNSKTSIELSLKKTGPGVVYSGDFKGDATIVYDNIPITLLEKDQELELTATARLGAGLEHTKYVPGLIYYRHLLEVKAGNVKIDSIVQNHAGVIKAEKKGIKWVCDLDDAHADEITVLDKEVIKDSDELLLFVESFGMLDAEKIFAKAVEVLQKNLEAFKQTVE